MLTVFWESQGPVLEHYEERGTTINSAWYSEKLTDRLQFQANAEDYCRQVLCCCTTMPVHILLRTFAEALWKLKFEVMAHPPYSPDLAPSDYHLFGLLKEALSGRRFTSDQELKETVHACGSLPSRKPSFRRASGSLYNKDLQPAARGPPAALGRVLCSPGRVFHKIECVMNIEA